MTLCRNGIYVFLFNVNAIFEKNSIMLLVTRVLLHSSFFVKRFFANCCVMVLPPPSGLNKISPFMTRTNAMKSIPE